ncbi:ParB/RepB/Spo0J family partition protein [Deinococcus oregonensis]|uniref:ParB/RepB/Spo0J family partition protein n=1 Tax=Deinococcus oregonensis TaxID=1805970 RepID=A0ABV6AVX5_9DEIO
MAKAKRPTLSNTLAELVGEASLSAQAPAALDERITEVAHDLLEPNPYQPRRHFDQTALEQLAFSIFTHGILQPLLVRPMANGRYQIVGGERRWRAVQLMASPEQPLTVDGQLLAWNNDSQRLPVVIREVPDEQMRVLAAVENLQRTDLNAIDEVDATVALISAALGITEDEVSSTLSRLVRTPDEHQVRVLDTLFGQLGRGGWKSFFKNKLRIRRLPSEVLTAMREQGLDYRKATLLGSCTNEKQRAELLEMALKGASLEAMDLELKRLSQPAEAEPLKTWELSRMVGRRLSSKAVVTSLSDSRQKRLERLLTQLNQLFDEQEEQGRGAKG